MAAPMTRSQAKLKTKPPIRTDKTADDWWVSRIRPYMERGKPTDENKVATCKALLSTSAKVATRGLVSRLCATPSTCSRQLNLTVNCAWGNAAQDSDGGALTTADDSKRLKQDLRWELAEAYAQGATAVYGLTKLVQVITHHDADHQSDESDDATAAQLNKGRGTAVKADNMSALYRTTSKTLCGGRQPGPDGSVRTRVMEPAGQLTLRETTKKKKMKKKKKKKKLMKKKMATGSQSAVPATPMKSGGTRGDDSTAVLITPQPDPIAERNVSFDEPMTGSDAKDEEMDEEYDDYLEEKAPTPAVVTPETPEDAGMSAGRSGGSRSLARSLASKLEDDAPPVSRNLADELDDVDGPEPAYDDMEAFEDRADDSRSPVLTTQVTEQTSGNRPPMNGDTPAANKPRMIRQAVWADLSHELARPVNAVTVEQVAKDTVTFLKALGLRPTLAPSPSTLESFLPAEAGAELCQWKKKLCTAFGVAPFSLEQPKAARTNKGGADPARVLLPRTPKKTERSNSAQAATRGVFSASGERSPYFQDSHMVTPPATTRTDRVARGAEDSKVTRSSLRSTGRRSSRKSRYADDSSDDHDDFTGDGGAQMDEYLRQIREVSDAETVNPTPRLEVAMHRPLGQIPTFSGARNRSENSMQWLRAFVYEMKGTHAPPNEWCMPFELRLRDGAVHWHRQLTKKTKRTWTLLSEAFIRYYCSQFNQSAETRYYSAKRDDKKHLCDYLNRLNGYACNAGVQFENGGRKAKDHVKRFLGTCGDQFARVFAVAIQGSGTVPPT
ncbi:hypothetical protein PHYSODRAFT_320881 [Phytophthora sojae]|uniref:Retrotransposon gag domain-containing protein n=1 Tax=Phytophthora sojae (strain P6497) TaxID=1094619 RepID=G4YGR4_PHYSP|nr:hypothetical protein PHYSODRAFT_320881 [Phytophthora sojae]EGZ27023.1 hypothetical protein PHYSODRAFT_320881 [Phytophthora sojae]|eukprot:XP_009514298.1 hypothetical protein PHYSODRAFT_320881 [Phytophthora sojae]